LTALQIVSAEPALSVARQTLAEAIGDVRAAQDVLDQAARPVAALEAALEAARQAEAELARLRDERELATGDWLAGGQQGERPVPSTDELRAEDLVKRARADAGAADRVLAAAQQRYQTAASTVNAAGARRDQLVAVCAAEAAGDVVRAELVPAIAAVLKIEARLEGLRSALFSIGTSSAGNAAETIGNLLRAAKSDAALARDDRVGKALLNALGADPSATF
jgi:hypothetical protein